jgi:hypothetical protein
VVFDRMATVVLGRIGRDGEPLWHPRFSEFVAYYGFEPFLCKSRDPNRKGKKEKFYRFLEEDFIRGATFASLEDLNARLRIWLDTIANCRVHGTTGRIPDEVWGEEKPFLIKLPERRFPCAQEEPREVGPDSTLWVQGTPYTVPSRLARQTVTVRLYAERFEVLDRFGQIAFARAYVAAQDKGKLQIERQHYAGIGGQAESLSPTAHAFEGAFVKRFPQLQELVLGLKKRMKGLAIIHLRKLWRLAALYGEENFLRAATRVQEFRRFDAHAVRRLLERDSPPLPEEAVPPLGNAARATFLLGEVDSGSLDNYADLDRTQPTSLEPSPPTDPHPVQEPEDHGQPESPPNGATP